MSKIVNVTLVGVGGQGILLTSEILARTAALAGLDVKKSEIHGMSQRGGSVSSQVRFGDCVYSPIIPDGETDILVSFEQLEAIRCSGMLKPEGKAVIDTRKIVPVTVSAGQQPPVENQDELLASIYADRATMVDSVEQAMKVGNVRTANLVIAGALSKLLDFPAELWHEAIRTRLPAKLVDINIQAFEAGRAL
ncbi:MAG: indolepyruvate oxidoreductase subunit beta [Kiritimatiellae bacterium]|jgi:indolepyruvate ferredoxin oxidoreductase beta subunit|nr:indolepyruvate oxidoreductase subunit beta [Kiritimatiellia bacterium]